MGWLHQTRENAAKLVRYLRSATFLDQVQLQLEVRPTLQGVPYWTAAVVVGIVATLYSHYFGLAIDVARRILHYDQRLFLILSPLFFIAAAWLVQRFAPPAGGTGIPTVMHALRLDPSQDREEIHRLLNLRVLLVIVLSSLISLLGGGSLGREGPMVHIAACLFYFVGRQFNKIWPYEEHRSWIIAGGAAGIAAAFNAPLAGVVFVLEELAQQHFHKFKTVVISAAIVGGVISQWLSGRYLFLGYPKIGEVPLSTLPWALLLGICCGLFAIPFNKMLSPKFRDRFQKLFNTPTKFALFWGICAAMLAVYVNEGSIGGGISTVQDLLFDETKEASWSLVISRLVGPIFAHLSGAAGGFLAPSLALGAALGSKFAAITGYANPHLLVLVGMAAFLSAIVRAPFTAWVIVMEMTDRHSAIFPLMIASLISFGTLRAAEEGRLPIRRKKKTAE